MALYLISKDSIIKIFSSRTSIFPTNLIVLYLESDLGITGYVRQCYSLGKDGEFMAYVPYTLCTIYLAHKKFIFDIHIQKINFSFVITNKILCIM